MPMATKACLRRQLLGAVTTQAQWRGVGALRRVTTASKLEANDSSHDSSPQASRPSSTLLRNPKSAEHDRSVAIFRSVVSGKQAKDTPAATEGDDVWFRVKSRQLSPEEAWMVVQRHSPPTYDPKRSLLIRNAIEIVMEGKSKAPLDEKLPSAQELAELYMAPLRNAPRKIMRPNSPRPLVRLQLSLLDCLAADALGKPQVAADEKKAEASEPREVGTVLSDEVRGALISAVVRLWILIFSFAKSGSPSKLVLLKVKDPAMNQALHRNTPFSSYISELMSPVNPNQLAGVPQALLITYLLAPSWGLRYREAIEPISELIYLIETILPPCHREVGRLTGHTPVQNAFLQSRMSTVTKKLANAAKGPNFYHGQMSLAFRARNVERLQELWRDFSQEVPAASKVDEAERKAYREAMDFMVRIWGSLVKDDYDETLAFMTSKGYGPTIRTYTSLIVGWRESRQKARINGLWNWLLDNGIPLDSIAWSARISSLVEFGRAGDAVDTLHQMAEMWDRAVSEGRESEAAKPDIGVVNATLTGLLRQRPISEAHEFLQRAESYGIKPEIYTYNMLLLKMLRQGMVVEAVNVLKTMQDNGVPPDKATFTIVIEEVLGGVRDASPEKQISAVNAVFSTIEQAGQKPTIITYAKMIHTLVKSSTTISPAVSLIFAHMKNRGIRPSPQIFAILAEHYFNRDAVTAVKEMIDTWGLSPSDNIDPRAANDYSADSVFWEVIIRGYADLGQTADAKDLFFELRPDARVSLSVADTLLGRLLAEGDTTGAMALVKRVSERKPPAGESMRYLRHHFWHVAKDHGLMPEEVVEDSVYTV